MRFCSFGIVVIVLLAGCSERELKLSPGPAVVDPRTTFDGRQAGDFNSAT